MLIVGSKLKAYIKSQKCMTSSELMDELNKKVMQMVEAACKRAQGNKRTTVKPHDL